MAEMNVRGILRKTSPPKKRNLSTRIPDDKSVRKTIQVISHNRCDENRSINIPLNRIYPHSVAEQPLKQRYSSPELNTALTIAKNYEELKNLQIKPIKDVNQLTPRTKAMVTEKAVKKLNVVPNKTVYKGLPPVNVNDSVLEIVPKPRKLKMNRELTVDPEPILKDYLKPSKPLEYQIPIAELEFKGEQRTTMKELANDNFRNLRESIPSHFKSPQYFKYPELKQM